MSKDRRDSLKWSKKKANHGRKPNYGKRSTKNIKGN